MRNAGHRLKKAQNESFTLLFLDESGFYLLPGVVRTWAPKGETPLLKVKLTRDHLSVISAVTPAGDLYWSTQDHAFRSEDVVAFLKTLLALIPGKLLILWDGAPIHRSKAIKRFLSEGAARRIHLERLPAYAPELNPDEGIWHYLKHVELSNVCTRTLDELQERLTKATQRLAAKPAIIKACFAQTGLYDFPT